MVHRFGLTLATVMGAFVGFADESPTIAFYPFADQTAGTVAAQGLAVANSVSESYPGTIRLVHSGSNPDGTATFDADVPGQYIYSDWTGTTLLTDKAQSLHFEGKNANYGAGVSFGSLAQELYDRATATEGATDFTLEFFWKIPETSVQLPREYITSLALFNSQRRGVCVGYVPSGTTVNSQIRPYLAGGVKGKEIAYPGTVFDGLWHHMAISFNHTTKTFQYTLDYKVAENVLWKDVEPMDGPATKDVSLGSFRDANGFTSYITDIRIAAPRFSTGILATDKLLMAVNGPVTTKPVMPETGTVFLTTGVVGTQGTVLTSVRNEAYPMPEKMIDPADLAARIYPVKNSKLPISDFSSFMALDAAKLEPGNNGRQATVAVDTTGDYSLVSGEEVLAKKDLYSICTSPVLAGTAGAHLARGMALTYPDTTEEGRRSFTVETILKWNLDDWYEQVTLVQGEANRHYATMIAIPTTTNNTTGVIILQANLKDNDNVTFALRTIGDDGKLNFKSLPDTLKISKAKWGQRFHRLVLVYNESDPSVTVWLDNDSYTQQLDLPLDFSVADSWRLFDGLSAQPFTGWVDAVRITRGIVAPANFLKRKSNSGLAIIIR